MFIIVEGCDGTGKSTLVDNLAAASGFKVIHFSYPRNIAECDIMFDMYKKFLSTNDNYILDRAWYSDAVYGPIYRGRQSMAPHEYGELEQILADSNSLVIQCIDTVESLKEVIKTRGDDYVKEDKIKEIVDGFDEIMCTVKPDIWFGRVIKKHQDRMIRKVLKHINKVNKNKGGVL